MTVDDIRNDALLGALPVHDITRPAADRIRGRCHDGLSRRHGAGWRPLGATVLAALCGTYLADVLSRAITLLR